MTFQPVPLSSCLTLLLELVRGPICIFLGKKASSCSFLAQFEQSLLQFLLVEGILMLSALYSSHVPQFSGLHTLGLSIVQEMLLSSCHSDPADRTQSPNALWYAASACTE